MLTWSHTTRLVILSFSLFLLAHNTAFASGDSVDLQWSPNPETDLAGYNVYHGTQSGVYGFPTNVGNTTTHRFDNLDQTKNHYFAVTAYDSSGNESNPSQEVHTLLQAATPPAFTSPEPNSTLPGSSATFTWVSNGTNTTQWWLHFGTAKGSYDLFDTGSLGTNQSATIDDFPTDGSTIWARLWYQLPGGWEFVDFQYSAAHIVTTYPLTVQKTGTGTGTISSSPAGVTCGNTCTASFDANTSITLSANPASDSDFGGWSGGGCSGTSACTVSLAQATTVTAAFAKIEPTTYSLTVQKTGTGTGTISSSPAGVTCGNTCTASFDANTSITLSANPASDSDFGGWSGGGCSGTGACTVSLAQATTVTATFAEFQISVMAPSMVSPRQHSVLPGSSATLTWTPNGTDVTEWWLYVGTTKGAKNLFNQSIPSSTLSKTISGLPTDGNPVWVRFWWKTAKDGWQSTDVRYIAATGADATVPRPAITSPTGGTTLTGSTATFTWESHGTAVSEWWLLVGTKRGAQNLFNSHSLPSSTHSATAYGLPTDGSTVWAQLWWRVEADGSWRSADFQYTAANTSTSSLNPTLNTPTPGTRLPGYTSTFTWTPNGTDVTEWWLYVGTSQGAKNLFNQSIPSGTLSKSVSGLPTNGGQIWVRFWWKTAKDGWQYADAQYAAPSQ